MQRFPSRTLFAVAALALALPATAQTPDDFGSVYSRFGLGERQSFSSSQSLMMGGAGVALRSFTYNGMENPALWSDQVLTSFSIGAQVQGLEAEEGAGETTQLASGGLSGLQFSFPLLSNRLGFSLGYRPYTRVEYLASRDGELVDPDLPDTTVPYTVEYEGGGGLQQLRAGLGWRLGSALSVGASVDAFFGTVAYRQETTFENETSETSITEETSLYGFSGTLGALVSARGLLGEEDALSIGAALSLPTPLNGERSQTLGLSLDRDTLQAEVSGDVTLPLQLVGGVAYVPSEHWILAVDARYEPWSGFESDFAFGGFDPAVGTDYLRDRVRLGGGVQLLPAGTDRTEPYFSRTAYRLGAYWDRAYVAVPGDDGVAEDLTTLAVTGGLSLPTLLPTARFDLGFEAGTRGTTQRGLVRDLFIRGVVTLNFGERWFRRRKLG